MVAIKVKKQEETLQNEADRARLQQKGAAQRSLAAERRKLREERDRKRRVKGAGQQGGVTDRQIRDALRVRGWGFDPDRACRCTVLL